MREYTVLGIEEKRGTDMSDWNEEGRKRRDFRQCHEEYEEHVSSNPKKHVSKDFVLESFVPKNYYFMAEEGWRSRGRYKKLSDAEKAAEHLRLKDNLYKGLALRIAYKDGSILKEYPEVDV